MLLHTQFVLFSRPQKKIEHKQIVLSTQSIKQNKLWLK
jgi:hypothetical protein